MTPDRWAQIEELFHRAVECDPQHRSHLLDEACNGDSLLRQEVEVLLASEERASDRMQAAVHCGLDVVTFPLVGETISHYRILDGLDGGGMGLVYRAEDVKLGRQVALKFLPEDSAKDPAALGRFEREARSASALEHPNICPIYEFGEHEGQPFLVMQLLQGTTLRELLSAQDQAPLEISKVLDLGLQITEGLQAAHQHGIIHRDIKPANIFITDSGQAKILDFGLAKLVAGSPSDEDPENPVGGLNAEEQTVRTPSPQTPDPLLSRTGVAIGTAGYMSPEQARGEKLDARTDVFSFGLVLYEMATGQRAFQANSEPSLQKAILNETPTSAKQLNIWVPGKLETIIGKALEKDREARYQTAAELHADLHVVQQSSTSPERLRQSELRPGKWIWLIIGTVGLVLLVVLLSSRPNRRPPVSGPSPVEVVPLLAMPGKQAWPVFSTRGPNRRPPISGPSPVEVVPLLAMPGKQAWPVFSTRGKEVAFAQIEGQHPGIYRTTAGGGKSVQLTEHPNDCCPRWSPDDQQIAFVRYESRIERSFYVIPARGGPEHRVYSGPLNGRWSCDRLDWSPDGNALMFSEPIKNGFSARIAVLSLLDSTTHSLTSPQNHQFDCDASFSPDGRSLAFVRGFSGGGSDDLFVLGLSGEEPRQLTFGNSAGTFAWKPDGVEIIFSSSMGGVQKLWRISSSGGTPRPVEGIGGPAERPSISRRGDQLVFQQSTQNDNIWRIDLKDEKHALGTAALAFSSRGFIRRPSFSPDGKKVAFESDRLGYSYIWVCQSNGTDCSQVSSLHSSGTARWSPDGRHLVFEAATQGLWQVYVVEIPGGEPQLVRTFPETNNGAPNWSLDGKWIYFYSGHLHDALELWKVPLQGGVPIQVTENGGVYAIESDDGRSLYYAKMGRHGVWKMPSNGGEETHVFDQPVTWYNWALAHTGIYFMNDGPQQRGPVTFRSHVSGRIEFFDFATGEITPIYTLDKPASDFGGLAISPDGKYLLYGQTDLDDSFNMLVNNFR